MFNPKRALLYAFLLAVLLEPITGRKSFGGGHSYPKSGGLSGGGRSGGGLSGGGHGYPSSGSHAYPSSGSHAYPSSGSHGYPSSSNHGYPSSGSSGGHGYPTSGGLSGGGSSGTSHTYPSSGVKPSYPSSGGNHGYPSSSGSHGYPSSGGGLSGNSHGYPQNKATVHHTTHVYNYHYNPPQRIAYVPPHGGAPVYYPVYHGTPPTYVYQYKNSGSKYGTLLAGLALLNLGTLAGVAYANSGHGSTRTQYTPQPGEVCKFRVQKDNGEYEETKIDCQIISSFIYEDLAQARTTGTNTTTSVVTVTNTTVMNTTNMMPNQPALGTVTPAMGSVSYVMLPNGTLVPVNATVPGAAMVPGNPFNVSQNTTGALAPNGVVTSSVTTTTTTNTTLVNALDVKGKPVEVTPGMQCFVIRTSPTHNMKKSVPCRLLQTYADKSIQRKNSANRNVPVFTLVAAILAFCVAY